MTSVEDRRPPDALLRLTNPVLRALVPAPVGRLVPGTIGVLRFTGRTLIRLRLESASSVGHR